jgi:hypothetical protein
VAKVKTPAPRRAGTRDSIPTWLRDQLCADPELLRLIANLVRITTPRSNREKISRRR